MNSTQWNHEGVREYSLENLLEIQRALVRNPKSKRARTWEHERLAAITNEINRRLK